MIYICAVEECSHTVAALTFATHDAMIASILPPLAFVNHLVRTEMTDYQFRHRNFSFGQIPTTIFAGHMNIAITTVFLFLELPRELRDLVYSYAVEEFSDMVTVLALATYDAMIASMLPPLALANRQIRTEMTEFQFRHRTFFFGQIPTTIFALQASMRV